MLRLVVGAGQGREGSLPPAGQGCQQPVIDSGPSLDPWRGSGWAALPGGRPPTPRARRATAPQARHARLSQRGSPNRVAELVVGGQNHEDLHCDHAPFTSRMTSSSTGEPSGRLATPKTRREETAWSPKTSRSNSDAASATFGCSVNSGVAATDTPSRTTRLTRFNEPNITALRRTNRRSTTAVTAAAAGAAAGRRPRRGPPAPGPPAPRA